MRFQQKHNTRTCGGGSYITESCYNTWGLVQLT